MPLPPPNHRIYRDYSIPLGSKKINHADLDVPFSFAHDTSAEDSLPSLEMLTKVEVNGNQPSIKDWSQTYITPYIPPLWTPPNAITDKVLANTKHKRYTDKVSEVSRWELTVNGIVSDYPILDAPYNFHLFPEDARFRPMPLAQDATAPFQDEQALANRLSEVFFPDLERVLRYLALLAWRGYQPLNENHRILFSEAGTSAALPVGTDGKLKFTPDRCALASDFQINTSAFLVGDIKPSYKFQGDWYLAFASSGTFKRSIGHEYQKVCSQVAFYMIHCTKRPTSKPVRAGRYGYVITDQEVVLFKIERPTRPGKKSTVHATCGFPLRPAADDEISYASRGDSDLEQAEEEEEYVSPPEEDDLDDKDYVPSVRVRIQEDDEMGRTRVTRSSVAAAAAQIVDESASDNN